MLPALIAGGAALLGAGASLYGGRKSQKSNNKNMDKNVKYQKQFAQQGIQWKVNDAKAAGLHPLYAMGANTASFSPVAVQDSMGPAWANAGQDLSRAMYSAADSATRGVSKQMAGLQLERAGLENELLRAQIAKLGSAQVGPPSPTAANPFPVGPGDVVTRDLVEVEPSRITSARSDDPSVAAGPAGPAYIERDFGGFKANVLAGDVTESLDDLEIAKYAALAWGNRDKLGVLKNAPPNLLYQLLNKPDWVKRVESRTGETLVPFYDLDGRQMWKALNLSAAGARSVVDSFRRYGKR